MGNGMKALICAMAPATMACAAGAQSGPLNATAFGASGSKYETRAETVAGTPAISVADAGDFQAGQGVMLSQSAPRITKEQLWGPRGKVAWGRRLEGKAELRGYDGTQGDWLILIFDVGKGTNTFRWSEDMAQTWSADMAITNDWQAVRDGIDVRFNEFEWDQGYTVVFACRGQLVTTIDTVEGNTITLKDAPTRSTADATVRHCDDAALQNAIDTALKNNQDLLIPKGHYRLSRGLVVRNPEGITIAGENAIHTVLDISEGEGACIHLIQGKQATVRNLTMTGHSGFERRHQCGHIPMRGSSYFWGFGARNCNATTVSGTERVLIENCHGTRMASECFVASCRGREAAKPGQCATTSLTYLRCSATDCGRNAFNDVTCGPENTSVLDCRIVDVGGCAWEGASRFVKFVGNYVRNAGTVAMGNLGTYNRDETYPALGAGQHIVSNNVFESTVPYGGCAIRSAVGATQVMITDNLFVNFGSSAVEVSGRSDPTHYASANTTVRGNLFDMTDIDGDSETRFAIKVSASDTTVSDNQIYVRGPCDPKVAAFTLMEPAVNISVHDNLIRNCGSGILTGRVASRVGEVVDERTFGVASTSVPLDPRRERQCEGWRLVWLAGGAPADESVLDAIVGAADPATVRFELRTPRTPKAGDLFEAVTPYANWTMHSNTITGCLAPVVLERYGSPTSVFRDNIVSRGATEGVRRALAVSGRYQILRNHIAGFDEPGAVALALLASPAGTAFEGNVVQQCANVVSESEEGLWDSLHRNGNRFVDCGTAPEQAARAPEQAGPAAVPAEPARQTVFPAARCTSAPTVDGRVADWPWQNRSRVITMKVDPHGAPVDSATGEACAAYDDSALYLAMRFELPDNAKMSIQPAFGEGDGVEVSFRHTSTARTSPIFVLWGSAGGTHSASTAMGASEEQAAALSEAVTFAAHKTETGWACEWRLPFAAMGAAAPDIDTLQFNIGLYCASTNTWLAWAPTGGRLCDVALAGVLRLQRARDH
jgi:hypothetical protein